MSLTPNDYQRLQELFLASRALPHAERGPFLDEHCPPDSELRAQVEALLAHDASTDQLLPDSTPERVGPYRILETLGEGGMGIVYLAEQEAPIKRRVALKLIKAGVGSREVLARFELERQALALMSHSGIARVYDSGAHLDGRPYVAMEYVRGEPIQKHCDRRRLTLRERLELFVQVCHAIQHAHQNAIIHRDIKPSNVLVTDEDDVAVPKVIDFGIAKATDGGIVDESISTEHGRLVGTPEFMSPEQARGAVEEIDTRTDVYSLGVLLHLLLVGGLPFESEDLRGRGLMELQRRICEQDPVKPTAVLAGLPDRDLEERAELRKTDARSLLRSIRGDLDWILLKALEKNPARRYQTAKEMADDVERHFNDEPLLAGAPTVTYRLRKLVRRHRFAVTSISLVFVALLVGLLVSLAFFFEARDQSERATKAEGEASHRAQKLAVESEKRRVALVRSEGLRLTARAMAALDENPGAALRLAIEGARRHEDPSSTNALLAALETVVPHRVLEGHLGDVTAVIASPDGKWILSTSLDNTARLWNVETAKLEAVLTNIHDILGAAFDSRGERVVLLERTRTPGIWDARTGAKILDLAGHEALIESVCFSRDGKLVATGTSAGVLRIWDSSRGKLLRTFRERSSPVRSLDFSPRGDRLVSGSGDGTIRFWDARSGWPLGAAIRLRGGIRSVRFSTTGALALVHPDGGAPRLVDTRELTITANLVRPGQAAALSVQDPSGSRVAIGYRDGRVHLWSTDTETQLLEVQAHSRPLTHLSFDERGTRFATAADDNTTKIWSAVDGSLELTLSGHAERVLAGTFVGSTPSFVTGSADDTVRIWDLRKPSALALTDTADGPATAVAVAASQNSIAVGLASGAVELTNVDSDSTARPPAPHPHAIESVELSADGSRLLNRHVCGVASISSTISGETIWSKSKVKGIPVRLARLSRRGDQVVTVHGQRGLRVWSVRDDAQTFVRRLRGRIQAIELGPKDEALAVRVAVSGELTRTLVLDATTGERRFQLPAHRHAFRPDGAVLVMHSPGSLEYVDATTGERSATTRTLDSPIESIRYSPDGSRFATSHPDGTVRVWSDGSLVHDFVLPGHTESVLDARFAPTGDRLVSLGDEESVRVWSLDDRREIATLRVSGAPPKSALFTRDAQHVITLSASGAIRRWPLEPLSFAETHSHEELTPREFEANEISSNETVEEHRSRYRFRRRLRGLESCVPFLLSGNAGAAVFAWFERSFEETLASTTEPPLNERSRLDPLIAISDRLTNANSSAAPRIVTPVARRLRQLGDPATAVELLEKVAATAGTRRDFEHELSRSRALAGAFLRSATSVDALVSRASIVDDLVASDADWKLHLGLTAPSTGMEWTLAGFDDSSWETIGTRVGYGYDDVQSPLESMRGRTTTVYLRRRFELPEAPDMLDGRRALEMEITKLLLRLRIDDGCVVYVNGHEVARRRAPGEPGAALGHTAAATTFGLEPVPVEWIEIDARHLVTGTNCLAVHGLNRSLESSDFFFEASLFCARRPTEEGVESWRRSFAANRDDRRPPWLEDYLEARARQLAGQPLEARQIFDRLLARKDIDEARALIARRTVECLVSANQSEEALRWLQQRLSSGALTDASAWQSWFELSVRSGESDVTRLLAAVPGEALSETESPSSLSYGDDLRDLLGALAARQPIRINCGGPERTGADGKTWGRDRFFIGGSPRSRDALGLVRVPTLVDIRGTDDDEIYRDARVFHRDAAHGGGYRIPLPPGLYAVALGLAQLDRITRRTRVALEGGDFVLVQDWRGGPIAEAEQRPFVLRVHDGFLDLDLEDQVGGAVLSWIRIVRVGS